MKKIIIPFSPLKEAKKLKFGHLYLVENEEFGGKKITKARRVFKGFEDRIIAELPPIKCAIFTTRVSKYVTLRRTGKSFHLTSMGSKRLPAREISLPLYLLKKITPL